MRDEHCALPGGYEAGVGQGAITLHSAEHLASPDCGVAVLHRLSGRRVRAAAEGHDSAGARLDRDATPMVFEASNHLRNA